MTSSNDIFQYWKYFLGSKGAAIASRDNPKPIWIKAEKADKVVDTTGAGDSFVGTMSYYLAYHPELEMKEMVKRSCAVATISVQKEGTQTSFPYKHELPASKFFSWYCLFKSDDSYVIF